jgi:tetratricopeptide (TPR) repeat protein
LRLQNRDLLGAIELFREAIKLAPTKAEYHFELGAALAMNPRWMREAEKHLLDASRLEPLNIRVLLTLGNLYKGAGLAKRAEAQFRTVLSIDARNSVAKKALADMGLATPDGGGTSGSVLSRLFKKK